MLPTGCVHCAWFVLYDNNKGHPSPSSSGTPASACSGSGKCALGYETPDTSCVGCIIGYYKISGECKKCPDLAGLFLGLYIGVVVIFCGAGLFLIKKGPSIAVAGVGIDYYQVGVCMRVCVRVCACVCVCIC